MDSDGLRWRGNAMTQGMSFNQVISALRPLMKGIRRLGEFAARIVDMGLIPSPDDDNGRTALELRKEPTWKGYANGSARFPASLASEIAGRWEPMMFATNLTECYEEPTLLALADSLHSVDKSINKGNVAEGLGNLLFCVFQEAAGQIPAENWPALEAVAKADRDGHAYFDEKSGRICLGDQWTNTPVRSPVPQDIQPAELGYVTPLLVAYCEDVHKQDSDITVADIPKRYCNHFQEQRKAFYSNEWLRETSWNCIESGKAVFEDYLETMYAGVTDTNLRSYPNGVERLLATLEQATKVQLDSMRLAQIHDLIDQWSRKGSCHSLAAQERLWWSDK